MAFLEHLSSDLASRGHLLPQGEKGRTRQQARHQCQKISLPPHDLHHRRRGRRLARLFDRATRQTAPRPRDLRTGRGAYRFRPNALFKIGSCTKTFIAAALVKLRPGRHARPRRADRLLVSRPSRRRGHFGAPTRQPSRWLAGVRVLHTDDPDRHWTPAATGRLAFRVGTQ